MIKRLILMACLGMSPLMAQADDAKIAAAEHAMSEALESFRAGDLSVMMARRPPAQLDVLTEAAATTTDALLKAHAGRVRASLEIVNVEYSGVLRGRTELKTTSTGREYALVWTEEYWRLDELNLHRLVSPSIALEIDGTWYFTPVRKARDTISLRRAYPDFFGVDLPQQQMSRVFDNTLPADLKQPE